MFKVNNHLSLHFYVKIFFLQNKCAKTLCITSSECKMTNLRSLIKRAGGQGVNLDYYQCCSNFDLKSWMWNTFHENCQALSPFCVCLSKSFKKWTQTDTKVFFQPPPSPPTRNFFWCQMKGLAKIRLFYSGAMALILPW